MNDYAAQPTLIVSYPLEWTEAAYAAKFEDLKAFLDCHWQHYVLLPDDIAAPEYRVQINGVITPSLATLKGQSRDLRSIALSLLAVLLSLIALLVSLGVV